MNLLTYTKTAQCAWVMSVLQLRIGNLLHLKKELQLLLKMEIMLRKVKSIENNSQKRYTKLSLISRNQNEDHKE